MSTREHNGDPLPEDFEASGPVSAAEEAAALWLVRLTSGETTEQERAEFAAWRAADPLHEAALANLRALWTNLGPLLDRPVAVTAVTLRSSPNHGSLRPPRARRRRSLRIWAAAASFAVATAFGLQVLSTNWHDEVTAEGERRSLALADGSSVLMNSDTALDIQVDATQREIRLARGEAFFEVVHDATRPFVVHAGQDEIRVLGTRFSVHRDADDLQVTVEDGRVQVRHGEQIAVLTANQSVRRHGDELLQVEPVDPNVALSWRRGRLILRNASVREIVHLLDSHHPAKLLMTDTQIGERRLDAVIDLDRIDDWLLGLQRSESVDINRIGPFVLIH